MHSYIKTIQPNIEARQNLHYPKEPQRFELYTKDFKEELSRSTSEWNTFNTHDPHIFKDEASGYYYVYSTDLGKPGIHIRKSVDLIHWDFVGTGLMDGVPKEANEWTQATGLWAPDIIKVGNEYRIYYSASTFGSQQSCIGLAVSDHPEGPFTAKGLVIKSTPQSPINAIDANIAVDAKSGEQYLIYGSFWGGISLVKLDSKTGFVAEEGFGKRIASRPRAGVDTSVEGAYVIYNEDTGYYYLFVSYGSLSSDYNVRVGRSRHIGGPYLDYHGVDLTQLDDEPNAIGFKITTGYKFKDHLGWFALGHNSVLNDNGDWYLVHHTRPDRGATWPYLQVRKMVWSKKGWPLVSPSCYAGEKLQPILDTCIVGAYERIEFDPLTTEMVEQSKTIYLKQDHTCLINEEYGTWYLEGDQNLIIEYENHQEEYIVMTAWDDQEWKPTIVATGLNEQGICRWMKQVN